MINPWTDEELHDVYECDGCGAIKTAPKDTEPPYGYHGGVSEIADWGGSGPDWYACRPRCISKAVISALARARDDRG